MVRVLSLAAASLALAVVDPPRAAHEPVLAGVRMMYGPSPETASLDLDALARARSSVDMAAFVLTDGESSALSATPRAAASGFVSTWTAAKRLA